MQSNNPRIELTRLCKIIDTETSKYDILSFYGSKPLSSLFADDQTWNILILLGDKGSGKTTEIKYIAENEKKDVSFFSELDNYYKNNKKIEENIKFAFFDSIDEFELSIENNQKTTAFGEILQKIKSNTPKKCKIIFTCRESDFSDDKLTQIKRMFKSEDVEKNDDETDFSDTASAQNATITKTIEPVIEVYKLLPLNNKGIEALCYDLIPAQAASFLLEKEKAAIHEEFFETPVECIDTMKFFQRYGKLPKESYKDLMDFLQHKLYFRYRELNHAPQTKLSLQKIKTLSQRIAVINSLTDRPSIIKKEDYNTSKEQIQTSVDVSVMDAFPEESNETLTEYINSTLFSSNGHNRVKFYNETIRHYLVYLWLKERFSSHTYKTLKTIIFQNLDEIVFPREALFIPIVMLSAEEYRIKKILIEQYPELLMRFAHYSNLNIEDKKCIFNNLTNKYKYRLLDLKPYANPDDKIGLKMFTDSILLDEYIKHYSSCEFHGQYILLYLIDSLKKEDIKGNELTELLWRVLKNNNEDLAHLSLKILLKQEDNFSQIAEFFKQGLKPIDEPLFAILIEKLYSAHLSLVDVVKLLNSFKKDDGRIRALTIPDIIKKFSQEELKNKASLINFLNLIQESDKKQDHILIIYINLLIQYLETYPNEYENILDYFIDLQMFLTSKQYESVDTKISQGIENLHKQMSNDFNLLLLEKISDEFIQGNKIDQLNQMLYMNNDDEKRLFKVDLNNTSIRDLFLSLSKDKRLQETDKRDLLSYIWRELPNNMPQECKLAIISPYCDSPLKKVLLQNIINPKPYEESSNTIQMKEKFKKRQEEQENLKKKNKEYVLEHIELIKSGDEQVFNVLLDFALRHHGHGLGEIDATEIEKELGTDIKDAYILGLKNYWQNCQFNIADYLKQSETSILNQAVVALPGVNLSFSEPDFNLTPDLAKKAIYFGMQELNQFPDWFDKVIEKYPSESLEILQPAMEHVLKTAKNSFGLFSKIRRLNQNSLSVISKPLWDLIWKNQKDVGDEVLQEALKCLIHSDVSYKTNIADIIQSKITNPNNVRTVSWFVLLFDYDIDLFISQIKQIKLKEYDDFFINVFGGLYEYGSTVLNNRLNKINSLDQLLKLISLVFKYAPPEQDIDRSTGGTFSPTRRDDATSLRRVLWSLIEQYASSRADKIKLEKFSSQIENAFYKADLLRKADKVLYKDISNQKFNENDIISLEDGDFIMPDNAGGLFNIVYANLEDIKENIEKGDHSIRNLYIELEHNKEFSKFIKEKYFQQYILMEMRAESKKLYSSVREAEVDDDKKPDLQVWERNFCTTIECKVANLWSFNALKSAITEQLVDKYLKHSMYEYGILLLFNTNKNKTWKLNGKNVLDFDNLIERLQSVANEQYKRFEHIKKIKVIGIKFYEKEETITVKKQKINPK